MATTRQPMSVQYRAGAGRRHRWVSRRETVCPLLSDDRLELGPQEVVIRTHEREELFVHAAHGAVVDGRGVGVEVSNGEHEPPPGVRR